MALVLIIFLFLFIVYPFILIKWIREQVFSGDRKRHEGFLQLKEAEYEQGLDILWDLGIICNLLIYLFILNIQASLCFYSVAVTFIVLNGLFLEKAQCLSQTFRQHLN